MNNSDIEVMVNSREKSMPPLDLILPGVESNYGTMNSSQQNYIKPINQDSEKIVWFLINSSFFIFSFGYMLPWAELGSLISYYTASYGADFYVKLNCAYYFPGFPVALLQQQLDGILDNMYTSQFTFMIRGLVCFITSQLLLLLLIWFKSKESILFIFALLGLCGWICHGMN